MKMQYWRAIGLLVAAAFTALAVWSAVPAEGGSEAVAGNVIVNPDDSGWGA